MADPMERLRALIATPDFPAALRLMREQAAVETNPNRLISLGKCLEQVPDEALRKEGFLTKKIAVLGGYTTSYVVQAARAALIPHKIRADLFEGEYGLFEQAIVSGDPTLAAFQPDLVYFCVGTEHVGERATLESELERWRALWKATRDRFGAEIVQNLFEEPMHRPLGNFELKSKSSRTRLIRSLNLELTREAPSYVHFNDTERLAAYHGRARWRDERLYDAAKVPVSFESLGAYARNLAGVVAAVFGRTRKCLVLDLDNTLWGGVIGDDGVTGIQIGEDSGPGEGFKRFQKYVLALKERGVILAVCSKNDEMLAREPFTKRSDMVLKLEDFSCFVANWEPKSDNVARIARDLKIGLDALVFVDDNPAEREIVRQVCPEVAVLELPEHSSDYARALSASGYFETIAVTAEDLARTEQYRSNTGRDQLLSQATDYPGFLRSLEMTAVVAPFDEVHFQRIAQLINKTNQFNLTTRRYGDAELRAITARAGTHTFYVKLKDKFGDNGLISVAMALESSDAPGVWDVDTWLMSCRVLKRGVEELLVQRLIQAAQSRGARRIQGTYIPTAKNGMVAGLYEAFGFKPTGPAGPDGSTRWALDLDDATAREVLERPVWIRTVEPGAY